jgi:antitoxin component YwqK of YwqJK toxin-antitoxin module
MKLLINLLIATILNPFIAHNTSAQNIRMDTVHYGKIKVKDNSYYVNDTLFTGYSMNIAKDGEAAFFFYNRGKLNHYERSKNASNGPLYMYYLNGNIMAEVIRVNGIYQGKAIIYRDTGEKMQEFSYVNGKVNGSAYKYYPSGKMYSKEYYENDLLEV